MYKLVLIFMFILPLTFFLKMNQNKTYIATETLLNGIWHKIGYINNFYIERLTSSEIMSIIIILFMMSLRHRNISET